MSNISWWRSWHGAPMDPKWQVIAARSGVKVGVVSGIAWALFDYASQQEDRGSVVGFDTEVYAVYSGFSESEVIAVLNAMQDKGIIKDGRLTAWEKRQPKREDDSTERVKRYREMKRTVTQGNAPEKNIDKDTDKEKDKEEENILPDPFDNVQRWVMEVTGLMQGGEGVADMYRELADLGVSREDVQAGFDWYKRNKGRVKWVASLAGPIKTAHSQRIQHNGNGSGNKPAGPVTIVLPGGALSEAHA